MEKDHKSNEQPAKPTVQTPPKAERPSKIAYVKYGDHKGDSQR